MCRPPPARRAGGQLTGGEHDRGRRTRPGPAAVPLPPRAPCPRQHHGRRLGPQELRGQRALQEDARRGGARQDRLPRGPGGAGDGHGGGGLRPVCVGRAGPADAGEAADPAPAVRRGRLHHPPSAPHAGYRKPGECGAAAHDETHGPPGELRPRRHRRRGRPGRGGGAAG